MNRAFLVLLLSSALTAGGEPSLEQKAEKRLHEILGTRSIQKHTRFGMDLTMIDIPDSSRMEVRLEQYRLFHELARIGTREAVRVLALFLNDERYIYEPGEDYGSPTISSDAEAALSIIQHKHPESAPGAPSKPTDPNDTKAWMKYWQSNKGGSIDAWRRWWTANKTAYQKKPSSK
jgi:hypothetical protein